MEHTSQLQGYYTIQIRRPGRTNKLFVQAPGSQFFPDVASIRWTISQKQTWGNNSRMQLTGKGTICEVEAGHGTCRRVCVHSWSNPSGISDIAKSFKTRHSKYPQQLKELTSKTRFASQTHFSEDVQLGLLQSPTLIQSCSIMNCNNVLLRPFRCPNPSGSNALLMQPA